MISTTLIHVHRGFPSTICIHTPVTLFVQTVVLRSVCGVSTRVLYIRDVFIHCVYTTLGRWQGEVFVTGSDIFLSSVFSGAIRYSGRALNALVTDSGPTTTQIIDVFRRPSLDSPPSSSHSPVITPLSRQRSFPNLHPGTHGVRSHITGLGTSIMPRPSPTDISRPPTSTDVSPVSSTDHPGD